MKEITRASCKVIRNKLNAELVKVGEKLGLVISAGNASYTDTSVTFKVECVIEGVDKAKENFERECFLFNLPADAYNKTFHFNRQDWKLVGLKTRSPKFPIIASKVGQSGKYKLPERAVASLQA